MENSMEVSLKSKSRATMWSSNPTPGYISGKNHNSNRYMHPSVHCSTIYKTWKQPKCPPAEEWIKMWYVHTTEYYSTIKKNKIILFATTCVDLQTIILREVREKQISYGITYMWNLKEWYKWTYLQNRNRLTDLENKFKAAKGKRLGGGIN